MYWPWQTVTALVVLVTITVAATIGYTLWFTKRHSTFFANRTPLYVGLIVSYNYVVCAVILLQMVIEYSALEEERVTGHPSDLHFPCTIMLVVSALNPAFWSVPSALMTITLVVRFWQRYRHTHWVRVLQRNVVYAVLTGAFLFSCLIVVALKLSIPMYRNNESGLQCGFAQEWFLYWPVAIVVVGSAARLTGEVKHSRDLFFISEQITFGKLLMATLSPGYYVMQLVLDALTWSGHIDRTQLQDNGLPFDTFALILQVTYAYNLIGRPLLWATAWEEQFDSDRSNHISGAISTNMHPSYMESKADDAYWLSELSDDEHEQDDTEQVTVSMDTIAESQCPAGDISLGAVTHIARPFATFGSKNLLINTLTSTLAARHSTHDVATPLRTLTRSSFRSPTALDRRSMRLSSRVSTPDASPRRLLQRSTAQSVDEYMLVQKTVTTPRTSYQSMRHSPSTVVPFTETVTRARVSFAASADSPELPSPRVTSRLGLPVIWTCLRVLRDPTLFTAFEAHAQRTLNGENTEFWKECEAYRMLWYAHKQQRRATRQHLHPTKAPSSTASSDLAAKHIAIDIPNPLQLPLGKTDFCLHIYSKYVKSNAPFELNVSDKLRQQYRDAVDGNVTVVTVTAQKPTPAQSDPSDCATAATATMPAVQPLTAPLSTEKQREQALLNLLSEVQRECFKLIETNVWRTFKVSKQFKELAGDGRDTAAPDAAVVA